tara:strand:- start:69 stop:1037 length:969 start_codon:yes stop_codon:yes gene_type:complete
MMNTLKILLLLILPLAAINAAKVQSGHIASDSKWMIHIDMDAFMGSELGQNAMEQGRKLTEEQLESIQEMFGIDLEKGLHGATAYGNGDSKNGVLVVYADADQKKLLNFAKSNDSYSRSSYNGHKIHSLSDDKKQGKRNHVCFHGNDTIVIAQSKDLVHKALDVIDGSSESIGSNNALDALAGELENPMMLAYGDFSAFGEIGDNPRTAMLKMVTRLGIASGESVGISKVAIFLEASDADACQQVESILRGIQAMGSLQREKQPDIAKLANAVTFDRDSNKLKVVFQMDTQELIAIGKNMENQKKDFRKRRWDRKRGENPDE